MHSPKRTAVLPPREWSLLLLCLFVCVAAVNSAMGQQGAAGGAELVVRSTSLPKSLLHQAFHFELKAEGGSPPFKWQVSDGALPRGVTLGPDGVLSGSPNEVGEFRFVATVSDSSAPPRQRDQEFVLRVVAPLEVRWKRYPKLAGQRIEGSVQVSNQTGWDFDLTFVVLAVNEIGRATALGYQRFDLKNNTVDFEIPFGENLPPGVYEVHADVVGEVASENRIFRARVVTGEKLQIVPLL